MIGRGAVNTLGFEFAMLKKRCVINTLADRRNRENGELTGH
jgi:hypothetical protein